MKMIPQDLKNWPIFSFLEQTFLSKIHMVLVYGSSGNEALIVTQDGTVYGIGRNRYGCLGIGDTHSTYYPKKVEALCGKGVKTFAYGKGAYVLALTDKGTVYSWGDDGCDRRTLSHKLIIAPTIMCINLSKKFIVKIACGSQHSLALTDDGELYAWGRNNYGQLGEGEDTNHNAPRKVYFNLKNEKLIRISCGDSFSIAVTDNGKVYSWGYNRVGQLGIGNYLLQVKPCEVQALAGVLIKKVVCGYGHCLALSNEGNIYVWGANCYGELGLGTNSNVHSPIKLEVPEMGRVLDIAAHHYNHISIGIGEVLHENYLIDSLKKAFDDPSISDLTIQVQGIPIHVHKSILKIRCEYFRTMFQGDWMESNQCVIEHDLFSYDTYKAFLKYLYTDEVDLPPENALELLDLANAYFHDQLKRRCTQIIKRGITVKNVLLLYSKAIKYKITNLEEYCFNFAVKYMTAVIQSSNFFEIDEFTTKTFILKASQAGAFKT
ncbi:PREDICTED: RCC1 and BTB domain-containing protein 1-like [Dufourea novaeangliae]|uniref:RCC1 and BTB domain-containing protein 1-like n=1 Tax=Dufourea novaeangliae TaxID=178035 RepID=UPI000767D29F|nr:PREDICTED: RCC1 and BTB domain-containing protein 1-like [Dufourea novaeangliae]